MAARRAGFTIIEVLVAVAVIAVLLAVSTVSLRQARGAARLAASLANIQSNAQVFHLYSSDFSDVFPYFTHGFGNGATLVGGGIALGGVRYFDAHHTWPIALADGYFNGNATLKVFRTPRVADGLPLVLMESDYLYGCVFIASAGFWNPSTRTGPSQFGATRLSEVVYPDSKALLSEDPSRLPISESSLLVTSFCDGAARPTPRVQWRSGYERGDGPQFMAEGAVYFSAPPWPLHTVDGVRGRDVR